MALLLAGPLIVDASGCPEQDQHGGGAEGKAGARQEDLPAEAQRPAAGSQGDATVTAFYINYLSLTHDVCIYVFMHRTSLKYVYVCMYVCMYVCIYDYVLRKYDS